MKDASTSFARHWTFAIVVTVLCGVYIRLYPATVNLAAQNIKAARVAVYAQLRHSLSQKIAQSSPSLSPKEKNSLIDTEVRQLLTREPEKANELIRQIMRTTPLFTFYLLEADPYYYYHLTHQLLRDGWGALPIRNGSYYDRFMLAPTGHWRKIEAHPYLGLIWYRIASVIAPGITLMRAVAAVPLLLFTLCVIAFFRLCARMQVHRLAGLIGGITFAFSPIFVQRSCYGWFDTDPYNVLFPLIMIALLWQAVGEHAVRRPFLLLGALSGLYGFFWQGWLLMPALILLCLMTVLCCRACGRRPVRPLVTGIALWAGTFFLCAVMVLTPRGFLASLKDIAHIISEFLLISDKQWPEMFLTVGELKQPSGAKMLHLLGGFFFVGISLLGALSLGKKNTPPLAPARSLVLVVCTVSLYALARNAERFVIFLLTPMALLFTIGVDLLLAGARDSAASFFKGNKALIALISGATAVLFAAPAVIYGHVSAGNQNPIFNSAWNASLEAIRTGTPAESIVNSWWPPGHFIKAIAERGVSFDGATLEMPNGYWIASAFLSTDEKEAVGILRMLNTSGNRATDYLLSRHQSLAEAVSLIKTIVPLERDAAARIAARTLSSDDTDRLLAYTHGTPHPGYCYLYNDMLDGVLGMYFVSAWDFSRAAELTHKRRKKIREGDIFLRGEQDTVSTLWSVAGGMTYIGKELWETSRTGAVLHFGDSIDVDLHSLRAQVYHLENNRVPGILGSIVYREDDRFMKRDDPEGTLTLSLLLIDHPDGRYSCIVAPESVTCSVLFRLYYLGGAGLTHFSLFDCQDIPPLQTKIITYRIEYTGNGHDETR